MHDVFISYSHKDKEWLERLQITLKPLIRNNPIRVWDDTKIRPGKLWKKEIEQALHDADIAILLVSPNFLASDFITDREVPAFLEKAQTKGLKIIWIPVSDCLWTETEISNYQAAHDPSQPLDSLSQSGVNKALVAICREIKTALAPEPPPLVQKKNISTPQPQSAGTQTQPSQREPSPAVAHFAGTWRSPDGSYSVVNQNGSSITAEMFMDIFGIPTKTAWGQGTVTGRQGVLDFIDVYGNTGRSEITLSDDGMSMTGVAHYANGSFSNIFATKA